MFLVEVNLTSLNQVTGKMPPVHIRRDLIGCIVYFLEDDDKVVGFGVSVIGGKILAHKKFFDNLKKRKIRFESNCKEALVELIEIHDSVALMNVSYPKNDLIIHFNRQKQQKNAFGRHTPKVSLVVVVLCANS